MQTTLSIVQQISSFWYDGLILKLDALLALNINVTAFIASTLFFVLLLSKAFALCDNQILVGFLGVIIRNEGVALQALINLDVVGNPRETFIDPSSWNFRGWIRREWWR